MTTTSDAVGADAAVDGTAAALPAVAAATGTPADAEAAVAPPDGTLATGLASGGAKNEGWPLCLFQPSQSRNSEAENTTQRMVRRISFMARS